MKLKHPLPGSLWIGILLLLLAVFTAEATIMFLLPWVMPTKVTTIIVIAKRYADAIRNRPMLQKVAAIFIGLYTNGSIVGCFGHVETVLLFRLLRD